MMRNLVLVLAGGLFVAVFIWASGGPSAPVQHSTAAASTLVGTYDRYSYVINRAKGSSDETAVFTPAVRNDDSVVLGALRALMKASYGEVVSDEVQPDVEVLKEIQYVTFASAGKKTVFQLSTDKNGAVWGVRYWQDKP